MHGHIRERKEIPNDGKHLTFQFCYAKAHKCHWHCSFVMQKHIGIILWLASNNGEMVIYTFLLGFSSHSHQKEWFKIWKIRDQPNHTNHIQEPQSSHCLVVHEDAHLNYRRYKVEKLYFKRHPRYTSTSIHKLILFLYISDFSFFFLFMLEHMWFDVRNICQIRIG